MSCRSSQADLDDAVEFGIEAEERLRRAGVDVPSQKAGMAARFARVASPDLRKLIGDLEFESARVEALEASLMASRREVQQLKHGPASKLSRLMEQNEMMRQGLKAASALYGQQLSEAHAREQAAQREKRKAEARLAEKVAAWPTHPLAYSANAPRTSHAVFVTLRIYRKHTTAPVRESSTTRFR